MVIDKKVELLNTCMIKRKKTDKVEDISMPVVASNNQVLTTRSYNLMIWNP